MKTKQLTVEIMGIDVVYSGEQTPAGFQVKIEYDEEQLTEKKIDKKEFNIQLKKIFGK